MRSNLDSYEIHIHNGAIYRRNDSRRVCVTVPKASHLVFPVPDFGGVLEDMQRVIILAGDDKNADALTTPETPDAGTMPLFRSASRKLTPETAMIRPSTSGVNAVVPTTTTAGQHLEPNARPGKADVLYAGGGFAAMREVTPIITLAS